MLKNFYKTKANGAPASNGSSPPLKAPAIDLLFESYRGRWLSFDSDGRVLAEIITHDEAEAEKLAAHASPYHDKIVGERELLTEKLWSEASRSRIGTLMFPGKRAFVMPLQRARAIVAGEIVKEILGQIPIVNGNRVVLVSRKQPSFNGFESANEARTAANDVARKLLAFEQLLAAELTVERNRERFFPNWAELKPTEQPAPAVVDAYTRKFGESRAAYTERMQIVVGSKRAAVLIAQRDAAMASA